MSLPTHPYATEMNGISFEIPALVMEIELVHPNPQDNRRLRKKAQIDTGADASVIPARIREEWNLIKADDVTTLDSHNVSKEESSFYVRIEVDDLISKIIEVTLIDSEDILLGRDVLNELKICADGKAQSFTLEDP